VKYLVFGVHDHQPVGNFDHVFEYACSQAYLPFLRAVGKRPWFRFSLHVSGCLWDWAEGRCSELFDLVGGLVDGGQVELMSGGMYEPILTALPRRDALAQIERMNDYLNGRFGISPSGVWLAERVWDPSVISILTDVGMKYTVLDESHFRYAGLDEHELLGFYLTEREGKAVALFPIDRILRYVIPFREPDSTIERIGDICERRVESAPPVLTYADDGEKFGVWPGTHKWVYEDGWLERFFDRVEQDVVAGGLKVMAFSDALEAFGATGRIYLPTGSYEEMMRWALPAAKSAALESLWAELEGRGEADRFRNFLRGGVWDNFLVKYPEANRLHKKMVYVSGKVWRAFKKVGDAPDAFEELWKGQCNCPYWHGLFGGLYLSHLRDAVWNRLLIAEKLADDKLYRSSRPRFEVGDLDCDGEAEVRVECSELGFVVAPSRGGTLEIVEDKKLGVLFTNNLARRFEAYHGKLGDSGQDANLDRARSIHEITTAKEQGLESLLSYDRYERVCFLDRLLTDKPTLDEMIHGIPQRADPLASARYELEIEQEEKGVVVLLESDFDGYVLRKGYRFFDGGVACSYGVSGERPSGFFSTELNFNLLAPRADDRYVEIPGRSLAPRFAASRGLETDVDAVRLVDEWRGFAIDISLSDAADLYRYPVETVSNSESGLERTYQCTSLVFLWPFGLLGNGVEITVKIERLKDG